MMFSFTRAGVAELRNRILLFSGDDPAVLAVRITTLDSLAWYFRYGTGSDFENLGASFEKNIEETIRLLEAGHDILDDYRAATSHLIIDESQDPTAARARLVSVLITTVPAHCGVTVFADPCHAIYRFYKRFRRRRERERRISGVVRLQWRQLARWTGFSGRKSGICSRRTRRQFVQVTFVGAGFASHAHHDRVLRTLPSAGGKAAFGYFTSDSGSNDTALK